MKKAVFLLLICIAVSLSGCATLFVTLGPQLAKSSSSGSTTTTTVVHGSFSISGTVSAGGLITTEAVEILVFPTKIGIDKGEAQPITGEAHNFTGGTFTYSFSTNEARSYYIVVHYPLNGNPLWAGGPGISANAGLASILNSLSAVDISPTNPNPTVNITLYQVTGP